MGLELLAALLVFVAVSGILASIMTRTPEARAIEQRLAEMAHTGSEDSGVSSERLFRRGRHSGVPALRSVLENSAWSQKTWTDLQQAGMPLKVGEYLMIRLFLAVSGVLGALLIVGAGGPGILLVVLGGLIGYFLPAIYVRIRRERRRNLISKQMVEALHLISNALRSGFAFTQAVEMAAKQLPPPIQDEFTQFLRDTNLGAKMDNALQAMVERTGSIDVDMLVTTLLVQRVTGGNLSEVLDNVAATVKERHELQAEIQALTGQQRLTGFILSIYPVVLGLLFFAMAPHIWSVMFTEPAGRIVLAVALFFQVMGMLWIRQILKLDV